MNAPRVMGPEVFGLGCRLNIAESERLRELLSGERDLVIVNSCSVTAEAVRHTRRTIRRAREAHPAARLFVTGCAAETEPAELAALPGVDALVSNAAKLDPRSYGASDATVLPAVASPPARTRAFVPIQNGCDHSCTFCIIPQGRGSSRSESIVVVLENVERHLARGIAEIVLTGVDITSWGTDLDGEPPLGSLVAAILDSFPDLARLRLSSLDGAEIDPLLLDLIGSAPRLMPHIHLSLQHGHDLILKRMKRRHSRADAITLVEALRAQRPEIAIGADLIAGFPTETGEHHRANLSLAREIGIVHGHVFPYSPRHDTPAARMPQVDVATIKRRAAELRAEIASTRDGWLTSLIGKPLRVLAERDGKGYAENYARVAAPGIGPGRIATIIPASIEDDLLQ